MAGKADRLFVDSRLDRSILKDRAGEEEMSMLLGLQRSSNRWPPGHIRSRKVEAAEERELLHPVDRLPGLRKTPRLRSGMLLAGLLLRKIRSKEGIWGCEVLGMVLSSLDRKGDLSLDVPRSKLSSFGSHYPTFRIEL